MLQHQPIGPLRRSWVLGEERIILASALMAHLRKRTHAQRSCLSTCKAGALPAELRPHALMGIAMYEKPQEYEDHTHSVRGNRTALVEHLLFIPRPCVGGSRQA